MSKSLSVVQSWYYVTVNILLGYSRRFENKMRMKIFCYTYRHFLFLLSNHDSWNNQLIWYNDYKKTLKTYVEFLLVYLLVSVPPTIQFRSNWNIFLVMRSVYVEVVMSSEFSIFVYENFTGISTLKIVCDWSLSLSQERNRVKKLPLREICFSTLCMYWFHAMSYYDKSLLFENVVLNSLRLLSKY